MTAILINQQHNGRDQTTHLIPDQEGLSRDAASASVPASSCFRYQIFTIYQSCKQTFGKFFTITEKMISDDQVGQHIFLQPPIKYDFCIVVPISHLLTMFRHHFCIMKMLVEQNLREPSFEALLSTAECSVLIQDGEDIQMFSSFMLCCALQGLCRNHIEIVA